MTLVPFRATGDFLLAIRALVRTTLLFRVGGQRAVARRTREAMQVEPVAHVDLAEREADVWRVARNVWRAKRVWPGRPMCLQTSFVMQDVLRRRGLEAALRVGVDKADELVQAHAWLVIGNYVLDDSRAHPQFAALPTPAAAEEVTAR